MLIDFTVAALLILAIIKGYQKGFIIAVFSIFACIIGLAAALKLSTAVAGHLKDIISISAKWMPFIAFALVFLVVLILVKLGARLIERSFQAVMLGWLNRVAGILLYAALYLVILSIFIFYAEKLQLLQPEAIKSSQTYSFVQPWAPKVMDNFGRLIPVFKDMFTELGDYFSSLSNKIQH